MADFGLVQFNQRFNEHEKNKKQDLKSEKIFKYLLLCTRLILESYKGEHTKEKRNLLYSLSVVLWAWEANAVQRGPSKWWF